MARLKNGFLGNASGKLGNVVFAKWRDLFTARSYQPDISDPNTPAQRTQRTRMLALLNFLKPINQTFIRFFNEDICPESTPWAKAIKDNMQAVSPDGCISLDAFRLGNPKFPAPSISTPRYNPFIDQVLFSYIPVSSPYVEQPFPYPVTSLLGKYISNPEVQEFDTRHLIVSQPQGSFFSLISDNFSENYFLNWWHKGIFWMTYYDFIQDITSFNPNNALTTPSNFGISSMVDEFNTLVQENYLPVNALSFTWEFSGSDWFLNMAIEPELCNYELISKYTFKGWFLVLIGNISVYKEPFDWNLNETVFNYNMGRDAVTGGVVMLYTVFTPEGEQVTRFNRIYIENGSDGKTYPLFKQLFMTSLSHPSSFILTGNQCGFCGSIDELFSTFKELWEQGIIYDTSDPDAPDPAGQTFYYDKFLCEVYTPDGEFLFKASVNSQNTFFADSLVPNQDYNIVFSYDNILIELLVFNCPDAGKVIYLSPAHIISNKSVSDPPPNFMIEIKSKTKRREIFNVPRMPWASATIESYIKNNPPDKASCLCPKNPKRFKAGADLAGKIK